jgi:D-threo-aldose 1-dehydrogenase
MRHDRDMAKLTRSRLGRTPVEVTRLGFGGGPLGGLFTPVSEESAAAALAAAWDRGIRYFDTSPHYGIGVSERLTGAALRDRPRAEYTLSTKVGRILEPLDEPDGMDTSRRRSERGIRRWPNCGPRAWRARSAPACTTPRC